MKRRLKRLKQKFILGEFDQLQIAPDDKDAQNLIKRLKGKKNG